MKRLSLQWRLTLVTAVLVTAACLLLNLFLSHSAVLRIDELGSYLVNIDPVVESSFVIEMDEPELSALVEQSKQTFRFQSVAATLAVILTSSALTYFLTGRALAPLRKFSAHMETIQAQNLSDPLEEPGTGDEIARLTHSYNEMLIRLDQAFTAQRQFSAAAAHELRTPLAVMQTNLDVLRKKQEPTPGEYAETVEMMSEQTGRLAHLVSVLLEMTELRTVQRADSVSLSALVEEVLCDLDQVAGKRSVTLRQEPGEAVLTGSDSLLYRAVYNLVENAIKYNRPSGTVTVGVETEDDAILLRVSDTGIGIPPEQWESVFNPFVRVDKSRSRSMGGAGLGLALVREIAEQHGGGVRVVRSSEKGTEILMELPV